jgi:hypothetical protein
MQARTRRALTIWWVVILALMILPIPLFPFVNLGAIPAFAWLAGIPLAIVTLVKSERDAHLERPGWYHAALGLQALIAVVGAVTAAHTVFVDDRPGLISIATVQLAAAILTWRAYTKPAPRRAIVAALVAGVVSWGSFVLDISLEVRRAPAHRLLDHDPWLTVAIICLMLAWVSAGLVCLATIRTFGARTNLPDARVA